MEQVPSLLGEPGLFCGPAPGFPVFFVTDVTLLFQPVPVGWEQFVADFRIVPEFCARSGGRDLLRMLLTLSFRVGPRSE